MLILIANLVVPLLAVTLPLVAIFDPGRLILRQILTGRARTRGGDSGCARTGYSGGCARASSTGSSDCASAASTGSRQLGYARALLEKIGCRVSRPCSRNAGSRSWNI